VVAQVRTIVSAGAGVLRDAEGLRTALAALEGLHHNDAGLVGYLVVEAALRREESRGGHTRLDFPATAEAGEHILTLPALRDAAPLASSESRSSGNVEKGEPSGTVPEEARELASEASRRAVEVSL
jgi:L-aspartate oxidase